MSLEGQAMKDYADAAKEDLPHLTIKDLPPEERPRERLLAKGSEALTDTELLAIIIRDGTRKETALDLARGLLARFGGLRELRGCSRADLCSIKGIGPARAAQILAALALSARINESTLRRGVAFRQSKEVFDLFHPRLRHEKQEIFLCLLLDTRNRVQREVEVSRGGLNAAMVNPREVLGHAIAEKAAGIILVHNHPSGNPAPSADDVNMTRRLKEACQLTGVRLLDHVIIAEEGYVSLADAGKM
jgi:DNA repair protein RadC